jgi:hypothetical protein
MCEMSGVSSETVKPLLGFEKKLKDDADEATPLEGSGVDSTEHRSSQSGPLAKRPVYGIP